MAQRMVIALGGNAIQKAEQVGNIEEQFINSAEACREIIKVVMAGHTIALTHGNGPQVGNILRRVELSSKEVYPLPLELCVADSQGGMGYMLQEVMKNEIIRAGLDADVVTVITRCVVDKDDQAFKNPTKPIGSFMKEDDARLRASRDGWNVVEDSGRGWRRVVPSPWPQEIVERRSIKMLMDNGVIVIACGGGGIPVVRTDDGCYEGMDAVIDKDIASAQLALEVNADLFIVLTGVEKVKVNFLKPTETSLDFMTYSIAKKYLEEGQFPPGSMGPKIRASLYYLEQGGKEVLITSTECMTAALNGETGTRIVHD